MERNGGVVSKTQVCDDFLEWEILSRLPVKSLMRFKCVCKRWQFMIRKDQFFIDLHSSRFITTTRRRKCTSFVLIGNPTDSYIRTYRCPMSDRVYVLSAELLLPSNEDDGCVEVSNICRWEPPIPKDHPVAVCILNGLICFMDKERSCASVYNCSTRESTPWIPSIIKHQEHKKFMNSFKVKQWMFLNHELGYDSVTKKYKVLAVWKLRNDLVYEVVPDRDDLVFEVLTVGQNSWRRIRGFPSNSIYNASFVTSVYVNGSIYLLCDHDNGFAKTIIEFNVGSEKFRTVETLYSCREVVPMEFNGRVCMLSYDTRDEGYRSIKMRILYDHAEDVFQDKKSKMATNSTSCTGGTSSNHRWVERTLSLPHHVQLDSPRHIPGTNLFIIGDLTEGFLCYHDNQKNKCYSFTKINDKISTALTKKGRPRYRFEFGTFTPNLLSVN